MKDYTSKDLALIVPTKDRPGKIKILLDSILAQGSGCCGQIIIVDGGKSIAGLIEDYKDQLPVEYYECHPPGQIRQRNLALQKLKKQIRLVAYLDDDLVLEDQALFAMLDFWNQVEDHTAGISFNIVNNPPYRYTFFRAAIGMSSPQMGQILKSGYNVPISPTDQNIKTQWLCGGATVWRKGLLLSYTNTDIRSRWAICEDISFSYPIGKKYPMYVCSAARVRHEHVYDHNATVDHVYYGRTATLWRLYFVNSNKELWKLYFFYMILAQTLLRIGHGILSMEKSDLEYALGQVKGLMAGIGCLLLGRDLKKVLEEEHQ